MNYRTMVKGALALSLSLIVGSSWADDVQKYGATFEQTPVGTVENDFAYTEGDGITNAKYRVTQDVEKPYGWFSGSEEGDESKIVARTDAAGGHALQLNTDANTLTNQLAKSVAKKLNDVLAGENEEPQGVVYFETDVKFVASDTDSAGIEGGQDATKFAIYAYSNEDAQRPEGVPATTNLVVYHAYYDENDEIAYTNEVFDTLIDTEVYTKLRIEMKKMLNPNTAGAINVFSVQVGNSPALKSKVAFDAYCDDDLVEGSWFMTVEDVGGDSDNTKVASLNFKGTGEIDNIKAGVIEEAQPLDDTWTIEGFNAGGTWPLPTASTDTALFYSNLVVNIDAADSSIGRTINAAWIGAKIIAPEAVTAETVGNWKFDLNATQTGLSFDQCKDGEYFMYLWVPVTAAKVRAAIANQSDIVYTVSVYQEGDSANAQPLTLNICPKNITITNTDEVEGEGAETIEVSDWREQGVVEPTVITIALVNGATYTDAEGVLTFAAPEGYVVNSIYTNGVDTGSTTTFTTNGLTGTINIVAAAKKVRPAVAHKWYENPGLVVKVPHPLNDSCVGQNWGHDLTDSFVGGSAGYTGGFARLLSIDSLEAGNAEPIYTINVGAAPLNIPTFRGSAISPKLNVMLLGGYNETKLVSLPLTNETLAWDENAFHIWTDNGVVPDAMYFSDDCQTLYANAYSPDANQKEIYKYRVLDGLKSSGTNLVLEATWNVGTRTRNTVFVEVGNKVFAYFHDNGTIKCIDLSDTSSSPVDTVATVTSKYDSVGATSSHLYVVHGSTGAMDIYDIAADGSVTLFKSFTGAELGAAFGTSALSGATSTAIVVTEDEATAIFGGITGTTHYIFVAQYVEPPTPTYDVDWTGSDGVTVTTNGIALTGITSGTFEENTVITFTPDQDTTITNILVDGVAQTGFDPASFTLTVVSDTNIVVLAGVEAQAGFKDPEGKAITDAAVITWLTDNGFTQADINALGNDATATAKLNECYLLNCNIKTQGAGGTITITAITVGDDVKVTVELTRTGKLGAIKGTLCLYGAADLATGFGTEALGSVTFDDATFATVDTATATFTGSGAKFFKAVIE